MVSRKVSCLARCPWETTIERNASNSGTESSSIVSMLPATRALETLNRQPRKRPRNSMSSECSQIDFTDLFEAVSGDDPFPKIEWPIDEEEDDAAAHEGYSKPANTSCISPLLSSTNARRRNKLRKVSETKMWSTNSLPPSKRIVTGLSSLANKPKAQTELNFQQFQSKAFGSALSLALSSYDQAVEEACKMAVSFKSLPEVALVSE